MIFNHTETNEIELENDCSKPHDFGSQGKDVVVTNSPIIATF